MIVYRRSVSELFKLRRRFIKMRCSDENKRRYSKRYRRIWFWHEDRWNQRHGENSNTVQEHM